MRPIKKPYAKNLHKALIYNVVPQGLEPWTP